VSDVVAVILMLGITAYALFGGADFGAGFWDLTAGGTRRGAEARSVISHSIGPVWEANHVWLIFCLVVLWTAFSEAFASITLTLFVPLSIAAVGIVFRGAAFAFRKEVTRTSSQRNFGVAFAASSVIVPYCMGAVAGAIASGRVPAGGRAGDAWSSWVNASSVLGGLLAVTVCAYLAAVYLVWDSRRLGDQHMVEYFRRRALGTAVVTGVIALAGILVLDRDSTYVFHGLMSRALPLVIISALCGLGSIALLLRSNQSGARALAMGAVATVVLGWGVAQYPYILPTSMKLSDAAAPDPTLWSVVVVFVAAAVLILPSLALLYYLDQRDLLQASPAAEPGAEERA
jgi:cytochrome d ubiquinol oxidase subunit II